MSSGGLATPPFSPAADRRNALDRAHLGDIEGALGTVRAHDTAPRLGARRHLLTLLAVLGPGLVVMVADNDAGTISVFSQAGRDHGLSLVWLLALLCPALFVTQEMVARLGAVTGAGHARLTLERFGRLWCAFSVSDLLALSVATLVTEFIGVALALGYFGVSRDVSVPCAAVGLVAVTAGGSFRRWERAMYVMMAADLALIPLALLGHRAGLPAAAHEQFRNGGPGQMLLLLVALVGTTIAPWQLFFQQSAVVDKRITPRWLGYERADTAIGALLFGILAGAVLVISSAAFGAADLHGGFTDVGTVIRAVSHAFGGAAGAVFAIALLNASLLCAGAVSLSGSYAISEVLGVKHSLHRSVRDARAFHGSFAAIVAVTAATVLVPGLPLGAVTFLVQALTGVLLPATIVLLLLLCNDADLLGPMRNGPLRNLLAGMTVVAILVLSTLLTLTTTLSGLSLRTDLLLTVGVLAAGTLPVLCARRGRAAGGRAPGRADLTPWERQTWSSPRLEQLARPAATRARVLALALTRAYVIVTVGLLLLRVGHLHLG